MLFADSEIDSCVAILEGKASLPEEVRAASEETLVYLTEFMRDHGGWSNIQIPADEFLSIFLCAHPFIEFAYLCTYPQYAFPLGYDEFRWATPGSIYGESFIKGLSGDESDLPARFANLPLPHFRRSDSSLWDFLYPDFGFVSLVQHLKWPPIGRNYKILIEKLKAYKTSENATSIVRPELWPPRSQSETRGLIDPVREILRSLHKENGELSAIHWRTLEEIVAELLRARGWSIHVTPRAADGGRDIVARGELVPGELIVLAVEVNHKPVVPVSDLRSGLWANRQFPLLLLATSGRFSAGVVRERNRPEVACRVILKDGLSLKQWTDAYGCDKGWPKREQMSRG